MIKKYVFLTVWIAVIVLITACGSKGANSGAPEGGHEHNHGDGGGGHNHGGGEAQAFQAIFSFAGGNPKSGQETELSIRIQDETGKTVQNYDISHEKLMHLIVVSRDFFYFDHIHPELQDDGTFTVTTKFPAGGEYKVFADFVPAGGSATTVSKWVRVDGKEVAAAPLTPDETLVKTEDGKEVELTIDGLKPNVDTTLTFTIRDESTRKGIDNLEPYLGAVGHVVILSDDAEHYLHVHPMEERATGPDAVFMTSFPHKGTFKIWGQFQHEGKVFTVPFVINVP